MRSNVRPALLLFLSACGGPDGATPPVTTPTTPSPTFSRPLVTALVDGLSHETGLVRYLATARLQALALAPETREATLTALLAAVDDEHPAVAWHAALILGRLREPKAAVALVAVLERHRAELEKPRSVAPQTEPNSSGPPGLVGSGINPGGPLGSGPAVTRGLLGVLSGSGSGSGSGSSTAPEPDLARWAQRQSFESQDEVLVWALGRLGPAAAEVALPALLPRLGGSNYGGRLPACHEDIALAIGQLGLAGVTAVLTEAKSANRERRLVGLDALAWMTPTAASIDTLKNAIPDADADMRWMAVHSLHNLLVRCDGAGYWSVLAGETACTDAEQPTRAARDALAQVLLDVPAELDRIGFDKIDTVHELLNFLDSSLNAGSPLLRSLAEPVARLLSAKKVCQTRPVDQIVKALHALDGQGERLAALRRRREPCIREAFAELNRQDRSRSPPEWLARGRPLSTVIEELRAAVRDPEQHPLLQHLFALYEVDPATIDYRLLLDVIERDEPALQWAAVSGLRTADEMTPVPDEVFLSLLVHPQIAVRAPAADALFSRVLIEDRGVPDPEAQGRLVERLDTLLRGPIARLEVDTRATRQAMCDSYLKVTREKRCPELDAIEPLLRVMTTLRREPRFSTDLHQGRLPRLPPCWAELGIENASPACPEPPPFVPMKADGAFAGITVRHRQVASDLLHNLPVNEATREAFLRSFISIEVQVEEGPSVQRGLTWRAHVRDELAALGRLFAEFTGCTQQFPVLSQTHAIRSGPCLAAGKVTVSLDGFTRSPVPRGSETEVRSSDGELRFTERYPTPGTHLIRVQYEVLPSPPASEPAPKTQASPFSLVLQQEVTVEVADDGRGNLTPRDDEELAETLSRELKVILSRPIGPSANESAAWWTDLLLNDPQQREVKLAYRFEARLGGPDGPLVPVDKPSGIFSDHFSVPVALTLDLKGLPDGVSRLVVRLLPDKDLAASSPSALPWLRTPMLLPPVYVIRNPAAVNEAWAPDLAEIVAGSPHPEVRLTALRLLTELGPKAAPALTAVQGLLHDRERWFESTPFGHGGIHTELAAAFDLLRAMGKSGRAAAPEVRAILAATLEDAKETESLNHEIAEQLALTLGHIGDKKDAAPLKQLITLADPSPKPCPANVKEDWHMTCAEFREMKHERNNDETRAINASAWAAPHEALAMLDLAPCARGTALATMPGVVLTCARDRRWRRVVLDEFDERVVPKQIAYSRQTQSHVFLVRRHADSFKDSEEENALFLYVSHDDPQKPILRYVLGLRDGTWRKGRSPTLRVSGSKVTIAAKGAAADSIELVLSDPRSFPAEPDHEPYERFADEESVIHLEARSNYCAAKEHADACNAGGYETGDDEDDGLSP
ncbi:MAG: hypothetical protein A2289_15035 [Deltaproteobacteria bacterium RIFOXYA12_FULL_58_15]|nr:MAG: hypothetical protein A2289_15035 [Deltaproteobacteria bacterium RIFOXYA12_FULL_58_15]